MLAMLNVHSADVLASTEEIIDRFAAAVSPDA
jgi:hypothetical protein